MDVDSSNMKMYLRTVKRVKLLSKKKDIQAKAELISEVRKHDCIWDIQSEFHRDRVAVEAAWTEIAQATGSQRALIRKRWKSLRDHFRIIFTSITKGKRSGSGLDDIKDQIEGVKWPHFKSLLFLKYRDSETVSNVLLPEAEDYGLETQLDSNVDVYSPILTNGETPNMDSMSVTNSGQAAKALPPAIIQKSQNAEPDIAPAIMHHGQRQGLKTAQKRCNYEMTDNLLASLSNINKELTAQKPADSVDRFLQYLGPILRQIPGDKERSSQQAILQIANLYVDGLTPVILPGKNLMQEITVHEENV